MKQFGTQIFQKFFAKKDIGGEISINDLRDMEFSGERLGSDEKRALANFDKYRVRILNAQEDEEMYHKTYRQLQVIANLGDWKEFLKEEYN